MRKLAIVAALTVVSIALRGPAAADELQISVVSGTGSLGIADGPRTAASFLMPTGIALDRAGNLIVADSAAQRIRSIASNGTVTTLAGSGAINASGVWVDGGYADGAAASARFDRPEGVGVLSSGAIIVADRNNRCLRSIAANRVTTYAGTAESSGVPHAVDGPRSEARFLSPRGLAVDRDGAVYVADWGAGVRVVSPDGNVTTLHVPGYAFERVTGVAVGHQGTAKTLFVADDLGIVRVPMPTGAPLRVHAFPPGTNTATTPVIAGSEPLGVPYAIAAFDTGDVAFTDLRDSTVKYVRIAQVLRHLGRVPLETAMLTGGGPGAGSPDFEYDAPMGIATGSDGTVYVADSGNRRIVRVAPFERKTYVTAANLAVDFAPNSYRIALVGSSFTWWGSTVDDSIGGNMLRDLNDVTDRRGRHVSIRYFQTNFTGEFDLMDNILGLGAADCIVFLLSPTDPYGLQLGSGVTAWGPIVRERMIRSATILHKADIPWLVALNPGPQTVDPAASAFLFNVAESSVGSDYDAEHRALLGVLDGTGITALDLYAAFRSENARPDRRPLFNTADAHYSPFGRTFVAQQLSDELKRRQPWNTK